jgi:NAD(P)-dependent dehydrogenase (short-subunit alcohol dehydrogenase family)
MGCVVNLLDQKLFNLNPDFFSYTLSKSALQTATTMMAMALAPKLRIVGIAPGLSLMSGDQTESNFLTAHTKTVLNKSSTPEDIANTVLFALGCQAITGSVIVVDGGQHLVPLARDVMFVVD